MTNQNLILFLGFAMLFSAGMGIGLVFYGAAEPMADFAAPPTADPKTTEAYTEALRSTFFHWGFHAWAIYGVVALALAYAQFRKGEPGLISRTLRPILGNKVEGPIGTLIDVLFSICYISRCSSFTRYGSLTN